MDNQEMQFADPAWQPPHQRNNTMQALQAVNSQPGEQLQQQTAAYRGTDAHTGYRQQSVDASYRSARSARRRRRNPFLSLIIVGFILLALLGGGYRIYVDSQAPASAVINTGPISPPLNETRQFSVGIHPTIVVTNNFGSIHIRTGGPDDNATLQISRTEAAAVDTYLGSDGTLHITVNNAPSRIDLDVTIANEADFVLQTSNGDINLDGVSGQVTLKSVSGSINLTQVTLARTSAVKTSNGDITFLGTITSRGNYQFESDHGTMNISLPDNASYHLDVTTKGGTFSTNLPISRSLDSSGAMKTDVGTSPDATVILKTATGSITLHKGK